MLTKINQSKKNETPLRALDSLCKEGQHWRIGQQQDCYCGTRLIRFYSKARPCNAVIFRYGLPAMCATRREGIGGTGARAIRIGAMQDGR